MREYTEIFPYIKPGLTSGIEYYKLFLSLLPVLILLSSCMKKSLVTLLVLIAVSISSSAQVAQLLGKWKTIDDADGSEKSIVYIFKATNGKYYGKIEHLFKNPDKLCTECEGELKNKPVLGMMVINGMTEKGGTLSGGTILDPNNGKVYKCNISLDTKTGKLNVRGSLDKRGLIGRSQIWKRQNNTNY